MTKNIMLNTDSYKQSHYKQYPSGTQRIYSYIESRGGEWNDHVFFGLQMFIKEYLLEPFTEKDIDEAEEIVKAHGLPFNRAGWEYILDEHGGYLPICIEAIPEGTVLDVHNALVQIYNTDEKVPWLTSFVETPILRGIWYPTTVATNSYQIKKIIKKYMEMTVDPELIEEQLPFKLHDFGARGVSSFEGAGIGGCSHLVNFMGTDTLSGVLYAKKYYSEPMAGFSIPASEHSTMTCWGGREGEIDAMENMVKRFGGKDSIYACVSDSYDIYNACENLWGDKLKPLVEQIGGTLVVRPDSGDPTKVPVECIDILMQKFGYKRNKLGYRVLPDHIRVIQGDGINIDSIGVILENMKKRNMSADNIAFGMGGGMLQQMDRDTLKFAMKASAIQRDGEIYDVQKDPITDTGKRSKPGVLSVIEVDGKYYTTRTSNLNEGQEDLLREVYRNGVLLIDENFSTIRERANKAL